MQITPMDGISSDSIFTGTQGRLLRAIPAGSTASEGRAQWTRLLAVAEWSPDDKVSPGHQLVSYTPSHSSLATKFQKPPYCWLSFWSAGRLSTMSSFGCTGGKHHHLHCGRPLRRRHHCTKQLQRAATLGACWQCYLNGGTLVSRSIRRVVYITKQPVCPRLL